MSYPTMEMVTFASGERVHLRSPGDRSRTLCGRQTPGDRTEHVGSVFNPHELAECCETCLNRWLGAETQEAETIREELEERESFVQQRRRR